MECTSHQRILLSPVVGTHIVVLLWVVGLCGLCGLRGFQLFEVPTAKSKADGSATDLKQRPIDQTQKQKSEAASLGANFKASVDDGVARTKEEEEKEKERIAVAAAMKEWDDLMDVRTTSQAVVCCVLICDVM